MYAEIVIEHGNSDSGVIRHTGILLSALLSTPANFHPFRINQQQLYVHPRPFHIAKTNMNVVDE